MNTQERSNRLMYLLDKQTTFCNGLVSFLIGVGLNNAACKLERIVEECNEELKKEDK